MKIGIEAQRIFRPKKHGMDIYALELIRAIQQLDTQNEYVVFVKPDKDVCLQSSQNLKVVEVKGKTYIDWEQISLPKAIEQENIDLMHFTSNTASVNIKCPFILTLHDIIYLEKFFSKGSLYQVADIFIVDGMCRKSHQKPNTSSLYRSLKNYKYRNHLA